MRPIFRHTLVALVASLALLVWAAASAFAAHPELSGHWLGSFSGTGASMKYNLEDSGEVKCSSSTIHGEFTSSTHAWAILNLKGCGYPEMESKLLEGTLGYVNRERGEVGLLLSPEESSVAFPRIYPTEGVVTGSLIGRLGTLGQKSSAGGLELEESGAKQIPQSFEGESSKHELKNGGDGIALAATESWTYPGEVKFIGSEPTVETKAASAVRAETATLHGTVDPEASETRYYFEYGPTTSYGSSTAETSAGEGHETLSESAGLTGLETQTTYHYRIVATGNGRTVYGSDMSFTTGDPTLQLAKGSGAFPAAYQVSGGKMKLVGKNGLEVKCQSVQGSGDFTGAKEGTVTLKWKECKGLLGVSCKTSVAGEIESKPLKTLLAFTRPETMTSEGRETGLVLQGGVGGFAEFECGTVKSVVVGGVVAKITPLGTKTSTFTVAMTQKSGVNSLIDYEEENTKHAEAELLTSTGGGKYLGSGLEQSLTLTLTGEEGTIEGA